MDLEHENKIREGRCMRESWKISSLQSEQKASKKTPLDASNSEPSPNFALLPLAACCNFSSLTVVIRLGMLLISRGWDESRSWEEVELTDASERSKRRKREKEREPQRRVV